MTKVYSFFNYVTYIVVRAIGGFFLNLKVKGLENFKNLDDRSVVFIANHYGKFDAFLIASAMPAEYMLRIKCLRFMAYYKYISRKVYGPILRLMGAYPVYPGRGKLEEVLAETEKMLKDGQDVFLFPSGKISHYFKSNKARPGIAYLVKKIDPLIVPVFIKNTYKISLKEFFFRTRRVKVIFGKPFHYREVADDNLDLIETAIKITDRVKELA